MKAIGWILIIFVFAVLFIGTVIATEFKTALLIWAVGVFLSVILIIGINLANKD